ncbi:MAG: cbb3-type cytochrome c oxidase subunit II [Desulfuromonadaceae bacterium]|nr:cbb3-type cytochrome c oxidase subunit II [Desulfuromonadaceae bacterium]MDD5106259.1 cbb3-type cytochrome c oxidase subunit II [Desulfuromonadaceae bacterium]
MLEKNPVIFIILAFVVIMVGTTITMIAPFKWINGPGDRIAEVKPYTPLQQEGRDLYMREGCNNCHSQTVRTLAADVERYGYGGTYSKSGEFVYDRPHLWGSRRTGPDLARIGLKYPDSKGAWHKKHLENPQSVVPASNMPSYAFLNAPLDTTYSERKMKLLDFPYSQADLDDLKGKSEMDAIIAYMRKLGTDIPVKKAAAVTSASAAVVKNPFTTLVAVERDAEGTYKQHCASCHGEKREGTLGPALKGSVRSDAELFKIISGGIDVNGMPSFSGTLDDQNIWKLVTYIKLDTK